MVLKIHSPFFSSLFSVLGFGQWGSPARWKRGRVKPGSYFPDFLSGRPPQSGCVPWECHRSSQGSPLCGNFPIWVPFTILSPWSLDLGVIVPSMYCIDPSWHSWKLPEWPLSWLAPYFSLAWAFRASLLTRTWGNNSMKYYLEYFVHNKTLYNYKGFITTMSWLSPSRWKPD